MQFSVLTTALCAEEPVQAPPQEPPGVEQMKNPLDMVFKLFGDPPAAEKAATETPYQIPKANRSFSTQAERDEENSQAKRRDTKFKVLSDYQAALRESQLTGKPLLVVLGAEWCGWCHKLDDVLKSPEAATALADWVVVKVDVDDEPEIAKKLEASALPALRILGPWQSVVASQEGYQKLDELKQWLDENRAAADPAKYAILYDPAPPDDMAIKKLVEMLAEPSPMLRTAAVERLAAHRRAAAPVMVQTLRTGRLVQQLAAYEVLRRWQGPVGKIDPWQPATLQSTTFDELIIWSREIADSDSAHSANNAVAAPAADPRAISELLLKLMSTDASGRGNIIAEALGYGPALATEIRTRLAHADALDDTAREALRELLYNLLASRKLRLQQAGVLAALARLDLDSHRQAAEAALGSAQLIDEPFVDELTRDADPLVRELAIRALGRLGSLAKVDRINQLLEDSDPTVRAAVLRMLAEHPNNDCTETLCAYLMRETNEDLLVHGTKCLAELPSPKRGMTTLTHLMANAGWRVRAGAIDATAALVEKETSDSDWSAKTREAQGFVPLPLAKAIIDAAFEKDAFVAQRAAKALPKLIKEGVINETAQAEIAQTLADHPDQLERILQASQDNPRLTHGVDQSQQSFAPITGPARLWLTQNDPKQIERASVLLARLSPGDLNDHLAKLIGSKEPAVRITALRTLFRALEEYRKAEVTSAADSWFAYHQRHGEFPKVKPWYEIPESDKPKPGDEAKNAPRVDDDSAPTTEVPAEEKTQPQPANPALDIIGGFFGTARPVAAPADAPIPVEPNTSAADLAKAIPAAWLKNWQERHDDIAHAWILECAKPTKRLLASDNRAERAWANAVWLALGNTDHVDDLMSLLEPSPSGREQGPPAPPTTPTPSQLISWLPADRRFELAKRLIEQAGSNGEQLQAALAAATLVNSDELADWLLDQADSTPFKQLDLSVAAPTVLRARLGSFLDDRLTTDLATNQYTYSSKLPYRIVSTHETQVLPGYQEACDWLHERFANAKNDRQRAIALLAVAALDHQTAVNTSLTVLAEAKADSELVTAAAAIAFSDNATVTADRAATYLNHPSPALRAAAIEHLTTSATHEQEGEQVLTRRMKDESAVPRLWRTQEKLPVKELEHTAHDAAPPIKLQARVLLLTSGQETDLQKLEKEIIPANGNSTTLLIATALAKAGRTDDAALAYYTDTFEHYSRNSDDAEVRALYEVIRNLPGDPVAEIRHQIREKSAPKLFEQIDRNHATPAFILP